MADLPQVGRVLHLVAAQQLSDEADDVRFAVALLQHGVQHAGTEGLAGCKLRLEQVGEVVSFVAGLWGRGGGEG